MSTQYETARIRRRKQLIEMREDQVALFQNLNRAAIKVYNKVRAGQRIKAHPDQRVMEIYQRIVKDVNRYKINIMERVSKYTGSHISTMNAK